MGAGSSNWSHHYLACVLFTTLGETDLAIFASLSRWHLRDCALANARIIQFAPYLARKQEQEVERLLARLIHHSPILEGDIRAWVAAMIELSARY